MDIAQLSIVYHFGLVLAVLWISSSFNCCHPVVYFVCFIYLYQVNERYILKLRKRLQHEEKKQAYQKRLLSDSETVRWLSHLLVKVWPICMEQIASQKILSPIVPWFLEKYKPWTAKKVVLQELYLGRNPPLITEMRVVGQSADDDHLVLELGLTFLSADDMSAILAVQLRKRLGFGMWTKLHVTGMHVEGKVLVGVKFQQKWPFLQRIRLCFVQPPYFQMTVKPIFSHGLDVTEVPGIAGWLDKVLALAFEETLVEPNMLVVDVAKLVGSTESASPSEGNWFSVHEKRPIAYANVEIIEAADMKPSDPNGLADPYVKGYMGQYRFKTKIQKKTLAPKWQEEFKIPICTWESPNVLELEIRDKDLFLDDTLGNCSIIVNDLRGGQRHDKWMPLQNIKKGRLHMAITIAEVDPNVKEGDVNDQTWSQSGDRVPADKDMVRQEPHKIESKEELNRVADKLEQINVEGQSDTSIWVHHPGRDVSTTWEPRKGRSRNSETQIPRESLGNIESPTCTTSVCNDDSSEEEKTPNRDENAMGAFKRKMGSLFSKDRKTDETKNSKEALPTPRANLKAEGEKGNCVTLILDDVPEDIKEQVAGNKTGKQGSVPQKCEADSSPKGSKRNVAKSIIKHAGKSAHELKHRLSRKRSSKSRSSTNREGSDKSNPSDDESSICTEGDTPTAVDLHANPSLLVLPEGNKGHDSSPVQSPLLPEHVMNFPMSVGSCEESTGLNDNASSSRNSCGLGNEVVKGDSDSQSSESNTNVVVKDSIVAGSLRTC